MAGVVPKAMKLLEQKAKIKTWGERERQTETETETERETETETERDRERERERDRQTDRQTDRLQMVYCTLAIGPYTNPGQIHTHTHIHA